MPRSNRYMLPDHIYHLTHRCHDRSFLLRFARDRSEYRHRLREGLEQYRVALLGYCITSNHIHVIARAKEPTAISRMMQKVQGEFAQSYNTRKARSGAFWGDRFHCTMIDSEIYLWNCLRYIDTNMVRAQAVPHPRDWQWCGYHELVGQRTRYRLLDIPTVLECSGCTSEEELRTNYEPMIDEICRRNANAREPEWTESIAVGSEAFVRSIEEQTRGRVTLRVEELASQHWMLREVEAPYG
jgi:putative transposase